MITSYTQRLMDNWYSWERKGRGYDLSDTPVQLEPPFIPYSLLSKPLINADDGRHHTFISGLFKKTRQSQRQSDEVKKPIAFNDTSPLQTLCIKLPKDFTFGIQESDHLLLALSSTRFPVSFELISTDKCISIQFTCRALDASLLEGQLKIFLPKAIIRHDPDAINLNVIDKRHAKVVDFGLKEEFIRPCRMIDRFEIDPYTSLFGVLDNLRKFEIVVIQTLFIGTNMPWSKSIIRSVITSKGDPFFSDCPEMVSLAKEKVKYPLFAVSLKVFCQAESDKRSTALLNDISNILGNISKSHTNSITPLYNHDYANEKKINDILKRQSHRTGMLLNSRELASLLHFPGSSINSYKLDRDFKKTKECSDNFTKGALLLGKNLHQGIEKNVSVNNFQRLKHTHIIGATGTGKSTLLLNMICQDIENGEGIAALDPHGDLIENILIKIPESRIKDVVIIDPADVDHPVGFNILKAHTDIEKEVLSSDLVTLFRRFSTSWGDQMNSVLANAILALLESDKGGTLIDLRRFLIEKPFREEYLTSVVDPTIVYYWQKEYPLLKTNSLGAILTRLDVFLRPRLIRNMVSQRKALDFEDILNSKKILLIKLSQGLIGTENSYLLGSFIVSKIHQAALARQGKENRNDFFVYIDEFQYFITPSMSHILSGARKYHLGLILAHQDLQQLQKSDSDLLHNLLANAGTRICLRLGDSDARKMAEGFSYFETQDFQNLNIGEAIVRIDRPECDFNLCIDQHISKNKNFVSKNSIIEYSRRRYGTDRQEVERILFDNINIGKASDRPSEKSKPEIATAAFSGQDVTTVIDSKRFELKNDLVTVANKKEETQHRYLQTLIKKMAESKGYKAVIESATPDGRGKVDVSIEGTDIKIACEVSVTTGCSWELHNIVKCLDFYDKIFVCCADTKAIEILKKKVVERLNDSYPSKIVVTEAQGLFDFLDEQNVRQSQTETKIKGYRVKTEFDSISHDEQKRKRESVAKVVVESLRKMRK